MYWIEVDFANGKTLRKETDNLNESYRTYNRYSRGYHKRVKVIAIRTGRK